MERMEICRYCGGVIRLVSAQAVYGSAVKRLGLEKEYIYQCQNCNARVGCHKGTKRPLGHVANETLRLKRMETHQVFAAFWKSKGVSRTKGYLKRDGMKMPFKSPFQTEGESQRNGGMQDVESHCHDGPTHKGSRIAAGRRHAGLLLPHRL